MTTKIKSDKPRSVFFVTVFFVDKELRDIEEKADERSYTRKRCWGFLYDKEMAKKVVLNNLTDIYEIGYYNMACIEEIDEGIPAFSAGRVTWYDVIPVWSEDGCIDNYEVKEMACPKRFEGYCGWSLG